MNPGADSDSIAWVCSYCGTPNKHAVDLNGLMCDACGANELVEGIGDVKDLNDINKETLPKIWFSKPFPKSRIPSDVVHRIKNVCPRYQLFKTAWSILTPFDIVLLLKTSQDLAWDLPLDCMPTDVWRAIWCFCKLPVYPIKRFLASQSVCWLQKFDEKMFSSEDLNRLIRAYADAKWYSTNLGVRDAFADWMGECARKSTTFENAIQSLPKTLQVLIWQKIPECPGLPVDILDKIAPSRVAQYIGDANRRDKILNTYKFERFSPEDWRVAMRVVDGDSIDRFKKDLWSVWDSLSIDNDGLYDIIAENPKIVFLLPFDKFSADQFLFLLPLVKIDGCDLAMYCPFERFDVNQWISLLLNPRVPVSPYIDRAAFDCNLSAKLSPAIMLRILDSNPAAIRYLDVSKVPSEKVVDLFLHHPEVEIKETSVFLSGSKESKIKLLCECGKNMPCCIVDMFSDYSESGFSSEDIELILRKNPDVATHLPAKRIEQLASQTFFVFSIRFNGAESWMSNFDLSKLETDQLIRLIKLYPWLAKLIDVSDWSYEDIDKVANTVPAVINTYHNKVGYFAHKYNKLLRLVMIFGLALFVFLTITAIVGCIVGCYIAAKTHCGG